MRKAYALLADQVADSEILRNAATLSYPSRRQSELSQPTAI